MRKPSLQSAIAALVGLFMTDVYCAMENDFIDAKEVLGVVSENGE
jgi:hypothetical protein